MKARFVCYKKRYVHCNILCFKPATANLIEKNTSQDSFRRSLGSGIYLRISTVFRVQCLEELTRRLLSLF